MLVPILIVYPFLQRHFAKGMLTGGYMRGKQAIAIRRMHENLGATACAVRFDQHQWPGMIEVCDAGGLPGDLFRGKAQEAALGKVQPHARDRSFVDALGEQERTGLAPAFPYALVRVGCLLHAAAQGVARADV